jgi:hypothetical protein
MSKAKTYDPACYDLAASFLSDVPEKNTEANRDQLAALIQQTIENEIEYGMTAVTNGNSPINIEGGA